MEFIVFWILLSGIAWIIASKKGRGGFGYFLISLVLSPLIGIIFALLATNKTSAKPDQPHPDTHVRCPDCREFILKGAKVCKHCGCKLKPED